MCSTRSYTESIIELPSIGDRRREGLVLGGDTVARRCSDTADGPERGFNRCRS